MSDPLEKPSGLAPTPGAAAPAPPSAEPPRLPYELRIGVTGHCEIEDPEKLEAAVREAIEQHVLRVLEGASAAPRGEHGSPAPPLEGLFRGLTALLAPSTRVGFGLLARCVSALRRSRETLSSRPRRPRIHWPIVPHGPIDPPPERRTPVDLTVITSLAPGTDQLAARAILRCVRAPEGRNRILEAVLPMPADLYEREFPDEEDRRAFRELLALDRGAQGTHPEATVVYPDFPLDSGGRPIANAQAFRDAGQAVVDASEILLAVWDPDREQRPGGTADAVEHALRDERRIVLWIDPSDLARGLRRLLSLKAGRPDPEDPTSVQDPPHRAKDLSPHFHRLAAFNRDAAFDAGAFRRTLESERAHLASAAAGLASLAPMLGAVDRLVLSHFARADQLAGRFHALRDFVRVFLPGTTAAAVTLIAFQILFFPHLYRLALVELVLLALAYLSYRLSLREQWHEKWLYDRHLAERLRSLAYTFGVPSGLPAASPEAGAAINQLPYYRPANEWFVDTLARLGGRLRREVQPHLDPDKQGAALARLVREGWIDQQISHHVHTHEQKTRAARRSRAVAVTALCSVVAVAIAHALGVGHRPSGSSSPLVRIDLWIAFLTISIPTWIAAYHAVEALEDAPRMREVSARMVAALKPLSRRLGEPLEPQTLDEVVREARLIVELEGHDHATSHLFQPPEFRI